MISPAYWKFSNYLNIEISFGQFIDDQLVVPFYDNFQQEPILSLLIVSVSLLIGITILLFIYVVFFRFKYQLHEEKKERKFAIWEQTLLPLIDGDMEVSEIKKAVGEKDREMFGEFLTPYLRDTKGESFLKLTTIYRSVGLVEEELHTLEHSLFSWKRALAAHRLGLVKAVEAKDALLKALLDKDDAVVLNAAAALLKMRDHNLIKEVLGILLKNQLLTEQLFAEILFASGDPNTIEILAETEIDGFPLPSRIKVIDFMGFSTNKAEGVPKLIYMLKNSQNDEETIHLIKALGNMASEESMPILIDQLKSEHPVIKSQAASALGALKDERTMMPLSPLLEDPDWFCRHHAASSIYRVGEAGKRFLQGILSQTEDPYAKDIISQFLTKPLHSPLTKS
jgi:HEAT repeat protein